MTTPSSVRNSVPDEVVSEPAFINGDERDVGGTLTKQGIRSLKLQLEFISAQLKIIVQSQQLDFAIDQLKKIDNNNQSINNPPPWQVQESNTTVRNPLNFDFPNFSGGNPKEWIRKCEQLLKFNGFPKEEWLRYAILSLKQEANRWFWSNVGNRWRVMKWDEFVEKLMDQFGFPDLEIDDVDLGRKIQEHVVFEDDDGEFVKKLGEVEGEEYEEKFRTFSIIEENEEKLMFAKKISKMSSSSVCGNVSNTSFPNLEPRLSFRRNVKMAEFEVLTVVIGSDMVVLNGWAPLICKIDVEDDEDSIVHEIDVFYTPLEVDDAQLYLRPYWHPHELKESYKEVKVKPKSLEAEVILSVYLGSGNFNQDMLEVTMFHEQMLTSRRAFSEEEYTIGFLINNQLHLNSISEVLQFWPSMDHLNGPGVPKGKNKCEEVDSKSEYLDSVSKNTNS